MTVSVVIPALNEEKLVVPTIKSVLDEGVDETVVVDGGSVDGTVRVASSLARVVSNTPGRARQMNKGADHVHGDLILFLHADTRLTPGAIGALQTAVEAGAQAGCFRLRFDSDSIVLRAFAAFTALPLASLCFGDRGLFVTRDLFNEVGGFADIPMFEDLDIVRRLKKKASFARINHPVVTSSRRFERVGPLRQQALNLALWTAYHVGVSPDRLSRYYRYTTAQAHRSV
jgi:rSAM/selenodomain-associated transferase 2